MVEVQEEDMAEDKMIPEEVQEEDTVEVMVITEAVPEEDTVEVMVIIEEVQEEDTVEDKVITEEVQVMVMMEDMGLVLVMVALLGHKFSLAGPKEDLEIQMAKIVEAVTVVLVVVNVSEKKDQG